MRRILATCLSGIAFACGEAGASLDAGPAEAGPKADALAPADSGAADSGDARDATAPQPDAQPDGGFLFEDAGQGCPENVIPLITVPFGDTARYYVETKLEGRAVALQLDTGSALSFIFQGAGAPDYTPNVASVELGCESLRLAGRGLPAPTGLVGTGLPVVGLLGMEHLLDAPSLLDVRAATLTRFQARPDALIDARAKQSFRFDTVQQHALVPCTLDGVAVRLMFDTGAGDTLWVGQMGRPGDQRVEVQDAEGTIFPIFVGTATLAFPDGETRTIRAARAPRFPYFEETVAALGGNLHGLLGVTAFPRESLLISGAEGRFYVLGR